MTSLAQKKDGHPSHSTGEARSPATSDDAEQLRQPKPTKLKRLMDKVGIDIPTLIVMFKGSIPPIIGISIYQSTAISSYFQTEGYLIPIISVLALAILPRDRFIQNLVFNLLFICLGSAMSLLVIWSSIQARFHTSPPTTQHTTETRPPYNSSQSAVCAVWLFANIWFVNMVRAKLPSFNMPAIIYSILINASATSGPTITTTTAAEAFVKEQLLAMLFGMGLATGVSLFIFPISSRRVVIGEFKVLISLLKRMIGLQKEYLAGLAEGGMFAPETRNSEDREVPQDKKKPKTMKVNKMKYKGTNKEARAAKSRKETARAIRVLAGKLYGNMVFAKRDTAWGKLDAIDLGETFMQMQNVTISIMAMSTIIDIFQRVAERRRWNIDEDTMAEIIVNRNEEGQAWDAILNQMHATFQMLAEPVDQGLEHAGICLEILPKQRAFKKSRSSGLVDVDVEADGDEVIPGDKRFTSHIDNKFEQFYTQASEMLRTWIRERPLTAAGEAKLTPPKDLTASNFIERSEAQLYMILYMEHLMHTCREAVQDLVAFADRKAKDGTMNHRRLLFPSKHLLRKWLVRAFKARDSSVKQSQDIMEMDYVYYGDSFNQKKDPEYLPAINIWQHMGNWLRQILRFLGSKESAFGLRAACAAMSVGIMAFLEDTQSFFQDQRLSWAMITIAIGMTITSGQSVFGFFNRVVGSCLGMIFSLIIWYIVDQKTAGVIVFLWLFIFIEYYFFKFPPLIPALMTTITTQIIILGYELQVRKLGQAVATETGQPYYPTYLLAPYRLAVVSGGSLVAFFWTIFPAPLTDRTWLRQDLSATMYLLANYFSVINSTLQSQREDIAGSIESPTAPAYRLLKARRKIFSKVMRLMSSTESHVAWQRWEPAFGGRMPIETYQEIIMRNTRLASYLTLMGHVMAHPQRTHRTEESSDHEQAEDRAARVSDTDTSALGGRRRRALGEFFLRAEPTHCTVLSTLILLSNSMLSGLSLPPSIPLPQSHEIIGRLRQLLKDDTAADSNQNTNSLLRRQDSSGWHSNSELALINSRQKKCTRQSQNEAQDIDLTGTNIRDTQNLDLRGYAELIMMQMCNTLVCDDLEGLVRAVSDLVGVVDFSFGVEGSGRDSRASAVEAPLARRRNTRSASTTGRGKMISGSEPSCSP